MNTNYRTLGRESMERLRHITKNAHAIQKEQLQELLWRNRNTIYGKKYDFEHIHTVEEYQSTLPVTTYEDYSGYIQKMIRGEKKQLTKDEPIYYCISSGSTGVPKYLPLTETDMMMEHTHVSGIVFGMVQEYYEKLAEHPSHRHLPEDVPDIWGKIFLIGEFFKTYMENGVMNGVRSGCLQQWMDREDTFDCSDYTAVKEVLFPEKLEDLIYIKVRFALAEKDTRCIHGVFVNRVVGVLHYIEKNWDLLLKDMEFGTVDDSIPLSEEWKEKVRQWLLPNPQRAEELRSIPRENLSKNMIIKIWKNMRYVLAIGGSMFSNYMDPFKRYIGDVPVHHRAYAASEGIFGIARAINEPDAYILLPDVGFFEFLPEQKCNRGGHPLLMHEIKAGEKYNMIITNHSGLYRYNLYDVIEVVDFYESAPVVRVCYRRNQILSIAGEKTNTEQLEWACRQFEKAAGIEMTGYCVQEDYCVRPGRYLIYAESAGNLPENADAIMDACMCESNYEYRGCRHMDEIGIPHMIRLPDGIFASYDKHLSEQGHKIAQIKPLRILDSNEKKNFFAEEYRKGMSRT